MPLSFNPPNSTPVRDGALTRYYTNVAQTSRDWRSRQIIWVNGMQNRAEDHRSAGQQLSTLTEGMVVGVYNQKGEGSLLSIADWLARQRAAVAPSGRYTTPGHTELGDGYFATAMEWLADGGSAIASAANNTVVAIDHNVRVPVQQALYTAFERVARTGATIQSVATDIAQCARDFLSIWTAMMTNQMVRAIALRYPDLVKAFVLSYFGYNPAVGSLIRLLTESRWPGSHCVIVAHSQGNLITSGALHAVAAIHHCSGQGIVPHGRCSVFAVASPAWNWPDSLAHIRPYTNPGDGVTWLSLGRSYGVRPERVAQTVGNLATGNPHAAARSALEALPGGVEFQYQGMLSHSFDTYLQSHRLVPDLRQTLGLPT